MQAPNQANTGEMTPRERVATALAHREPDRVPVDMLATTEVWDKLVAHLQPDTSGIGYAEYFDPAREAVLRHLQVDCRLVSYDMFCHPPEAALKPGARVDWWRAFSRSTPNRMWRQANPDGTLNDIWGVHFQIEEHAFGNYEGLASSPLGAADTVEDLKQHRWPDSDWWDFSDLPGLLAELDKHQEYHVRFRIGSIFEISWQLCGMEKFLVDLGMNPAVPLYIMDRINEVLLENTRRVLELAGDRLDLMYFYDDVATQNSLLISPKMWQEYIRPRHARLVELCHSYGKPVMYHCDGSIYRLIPELIEMGIDVLNPIQPDAKDMQDVRLKAEFGDRLTFHGGIDIIRTLPRGTPAVVAAEVQDRVQALGKGGGYILCSSHHIQPDTPVDNILAMYDPALRYRVEP
jgi:uroporphyrinogen decarboxylase